MLSFRRATPTLLVALAILLAAPAADAATVADLAGGGVSFTSAPGVAGALTATSAVDGADVRVTLSDGTSGHTLATIAAQCTEQIDGSVECVLGPSQTLVHIHAGDMDDLVTVVNVSAPDARAFSVWGEDGDDTLVGSDAADTLRGGAGVDTYTPGPGADLVEDSEADSTIDTGTTPHSGDRYIVSASSTVSYAARTASVKVTSGTAVSTPGPGEDVVSTDTSIVGSAWSDLILSDGAIDGGAGNDDLRFTVDADAPPEVIDGGAGVDRATLVGPCSPCAITLDQLPNDPGTSDIRTENVTCSACSITGDAQDNSLRGRMLIGGEGADVLVGETVSYSGRSAPVTVTDNGLADDGADGGAEGDDVRATETVWGGSAGDHLSCSVAACGLEGGAGDDVLAGGPGNDRLSGGNGADQISGGAGDDRISGDWEGQPTSLDMIEPGTGADRITDFGGATVTAAPGDTGFDGYTMTGGTLDLSSRTSGVDVRLDHGRGIPSTLTSDMLNGTLDTVIGSGFGDSLAVDAGTFIGGGGDDQLTVASRKPSLWRTVALIGGPGVDTAEPANCQSYSCSVTLDGVANDLNFSSNVDVENVTCNCSIVGNDHPNVLRGRRVDGRGGADTLAGTISYASRTAAVRYTLDGIANDGEAGENDMALPGVGSSGAIGGSGTDVLVGGKHAVLDGGAGNDVLVLAPRGELAAAQSANGGAGNDTIRACSRGCNSRVTGGSGVDHLDFSPSTVRRSVLLGTNGHDLVFVDSTFERITMTRHADSVGIRSAYPVPRLLRVSMGAGDNSGRNEGTNVATTLVVDLGPGNDLWNDAGGAIVTNRMRGGTGVDTWRYGFRSGARGVFACIDSRRLCGTFDGRRGEGDTIDGDFENLTGSALHDTLVGNGKVNVIDGGDGGDDLLYGGLGRDTLIGGGGFDVAAYDVLHRRGIAASLDGRRNDGDGDLIQRDVEGILGTNHADRLVAGNVLGALIGMGGNDALIGGPKPDYLDGGSGNDTIRAKGGGRDYVDCGPGTADTAYVDSGDTVRNCERRR